VDADDVGLAGDLEPVVGAPYAYDVVIERGGLVGGLTILVDGLL
jgi:hypothetical protein